MVMSFCKNWSCPEVENRKWSSILIYGCIMVDLNF
jgi:hypothetical protein